MWTLIEKDIDFFWFIFSHPYIISLFIVWTIILTYGSPYLHRLYPKHIQIQIHEQKRLAKKLSKMQSASFDGIILFSLWVLTSLIIFYSIKFIWLDSEEYLLISFIGATGILLFVLSGYIAIYIDNFVIDKDKRRKKLLTQEEYQEYIEIKKQYERSRYKNEEKYQEYLETIEFKDRYKREIKVVLFLLLLGVVYIMFPIRGYTILNDKSLKIVHLDDFIYKYQKYRDIKSIKKIPQKEHIAITFKDGSTWKSTDHTNKELFNQEEYQKLKKFLESKTHR